jgi:hypothetical protein
VHLKLIVDGVIDGNNAGQDSYSEVAMFPNILYRNARFIDVPVINGKTAACWFLAFNNAEDVLVSSPNIDVERNTGRDPIHLEGANRRITIENLTGRGGDNIVGLTINPEGTFTNTASGLMCSGDMYDINLKNITGDSLLPLVGIWGCTGYKHTSITIDGLHGITDQYAVAMYQYGGTGMNNVNGGVLNISNVTAQTTSGVIGINGHGNWDKITLDNFDIPDPRYMLRLLQPTGTGTIGELHISRMKCRKTMTVSVIDLGSAAGTTVGDVLVSNIQNIDMGTTDLCQTGVSSVIGSLTFDDITCKTTCRMYYAQGEIGPVKFNNCGLYGTTTGGLIETGAAATVASYSFSNIWMTNGSTMCYPKNTSEVAQIDMTNIQLTACYAACYPLGGGVVNVSNYRDFTSMTCNPFACPGNGKNYTYKFSNVQSVKTDLIAFTAGALVRMVGGFTAIANVTAPATGDMVYDVTGSKMNIRNSGATWSTLNT